MSPGTSSAAGSGGAEYAAWVDIRVDRVLHGSLPTTPIINVVLGDSADHVGNPYGPVVSQLKASMPHEQGILFIQNLASWERQMTGKSTAGPSLYAVISAQGIFRNDNGVTKKAISAPGAWPQALDGKAFGDAISDVAGANPDPLSSPSGG